MDGSFAPGSTHARQIDDLVEARIDGAMSLTDAVALHELLARVIDEHGRCFLLCDLRSTSGVHPDARLYIREWNKTRTATATAVFGANFATRAIATMIIKAIHLLGSNKVELVFLRDEAEARQWLATRRAHVPA